MRLKKSVPLMIWALVATACGQQSSTRIEQGEGGLRKKTELGIQGSFEIADAHCGDKEFVDAEGRKLTGSMTSMGDLLRVDAALRPSDPNDENSIAVIWRSSYRVRATQTRVSSDRKTYELIERKSELAPTEAAFINTESPALTVIENDDKSEDAFQIVRIARSPLCRSTLEESSTNGEETLELRLSPL